MILQGADTDGPKGNKMDHGDHSDDIVLALAL